MPELRIVAVETASDAELIRRVLRKDEAAARALMQRYNRRLYRVARGVVRDDGEAEDVLQEAYLHAFSALADFRGESSLSTWLTRIVLNEALQRLRRRTDVPVSDIGKDARATRRRCHSFPRIAINDRSGTGHGTTTALSARRTRDRRASVRVSHGPHRPGYRRHER